MKTALLSLFFSLALSLRAHAAPLPALKLENATVSGISSGAFQSVQALVALSSRLKGAASLAGGIYGCAEGNAAKAVFRCMMKPEELKVEDFVAKAREAEAKGLIDRTEHLKSARILVIQSKADQTVKPAAADKLAEFFGSLGTAAVSVDKIEKAAHGFPTLDYGNACDEPGTPYLVRCGKDAAGEILAFLYPGLTPPAATDPKGKLVTFEQSLYGDPEARLLPKGYAYIPAGCEAGGCRLHIAFHGCEMGADKIGEQFVKSAGYNRWADANRIVVVYPQAATTPKNPKGCWDWFGHTGPDYAAKSGKQIEFISKILGRFGI